MMICGLMLNGATTALVGNSPEFWMASSVDT